MSIGTAKQYKPQTELMQKNGNMKQIEYGNITHGIPTKPYLQQQCHEGDTLFIHF